MAIFGRKRATSNPRPLTTSTSSAATLAASQAFLANKASNANLSSAAATAALRAHTPTPTPVGQIQTKRMQRRGSITSQASAPGGTTARPGGLQRRDSGGSMTERTFRSPSPNTSQDRPDRPASSHGPYPRYEHDDAPPVPALPKNYVSPPPIPQMSSRRLASVNPPKRISSPRSSQSGSHEVSLDRGPGVMTPTPTKAKATKTKDSAEEIERVGSRCSVNYSRPMSPQNSPPTSPLAEGRVRSPTNAAPASGLSAIEAAQIATSSSSAAVDPVVKKKKKVKAKDLVEESHLAAGTSGGSPTGTAVESSYKRQDPPITSSPSPATGSQVGNINEAPQPKRKKKKKKEVIETQSQPGGESFGSVYPSDNDSVTSEKSSTNDRPRSYNTRAAGLLAKQPSMVREDQEGEEQAEGRLQLAKMKGPADSNGTAFAGTPANTSKLVSKDRQHNRSASHQTPTSTLKLDVPKADRPVSLSPGRAAHFSAQPVNEGTKHQPPARSVSPAKSALKSSPSRGHSPIVSRHGLAPSDASDTASQYSEDGSKSSGNRKKSARVSFDDGPVVVGRAASPPLVPESPVILSPQTKSAKTRTWIDLIREQNQDSTGSDRDDASAIKPTPVLPSFGSIRDREQKPLRVTAEQATPSETWSKDPLRTMDTSTDTAVGQVIVAEAAKKKSKEGPPSLSQPSPNDPLPPKVTSVEGSGYHSDEGEEPFNNEEKKAIPTQTAVPQQPPTSIASKDIGALHPTLGESVHVSSAHVPSIAVQPATPGLGSALANRDSWLGMPGGFPSQKQVERDSTTKADSAEHHTPATVGIAEPEPEAVAAQHDSSAPIIGEVAQTLRTQIDATSEYESEDTAGDSVYSDAAEDQSDLDGDGFGSINAIVESPTSPNIALVGMSPPASPGKASKEKLAQSTFVQQEKSESPEPAPAEGWDREQDYWSGLSKTRKQQLEQAALPGAVDEPKIRNRSMRGADAVQRKKKKKTTKKAPTEPLDNSNAARSTKTQVPPLKSSMRASSPQSDAGPHMRSSMRDGPPKSALKRGDKQIALNSQLMPKAALRKKTRPISTVAMVDYDRSEQTASPTFSARAVSAGAPATSKNPVPAQHKKQFPAAKPKVRRANSDSDSSFKKARPKTPDGNRYTMKRSMRGPSSEPMPNRASSMSARISSPVDATARRPFSSVGPSGASTMRTSMRGSMDASKPARTSLRNSIESGKANRTKSPSRFSFIGSSKAKSVSATESKPASRFSSRFGDSSDEEGVPTMASSRFADSSDDDDEPMGLTPVRGIPRRINEGDSTDLEDSSEEKASTLIKANAATNGTNDVDGTKPADVASPEGAALATGSLRAPSGTQPPTAVMGTGLQAKKAAEKQRKKRSFFGSLSGRKRDDSSRVQKSDIESPARRDTPLERTKAERMNVIPESPKPSGRVLGPSSLMSDPVRALKVDIASPAGSQSSAAQNSPKSPKLQRRNTPKKITSSNDISWPLPQIPADTPDTPTRPRTSDGPPTSNGGTRPSLVLRHSVQAPMRSSGMNGVAAASVDPIAKKKKFSMLRKAFGLHN